MSVCIACASTNCCSTASSSFNSSFNTKSTNVAPGPSYSLARQLLLRLHKNLSTYVPVLYISKIIIFINCIFLRWWWMQWWPYNVATPLWGKCKDETHTPKSGNLESSGTPENSKLYCRGQNTLHWGDFYTIGKVVKCRCLKWPHMSHLDIYSTSYGQKKGR
jgi:hypothetical protein